jgi:hypothetical protein
MQRCIKVAEKGGQVVGLCTAQALFHLLHSFPIPSCSWSEGEATGS